MLYLNGVKPPRFLAALQLGDCLFLVWHQEFCPYISTTQRADQLLFRCFSFTVPSRGFQSQRQHGRACVMPCKRLEAEPRIHVDIERQGESL